MSRNILNNQGVYVNTISAGDGINLINNNTSLQSVNVDISKQSSKTTISDTDLFILEESDGGIKKITGSNMKSQLEQSTVTAPLALTGNNISIKGLSGFTANKYLKVNNGGDAIEYADSTSFWSYSSPSLRPNNTTDNVLIGTSSNSNSRKLIVVGNTELQDLYLPSNKKIISTNNSSDYLQFGNGTLTNNYSSNVINNSISMGASADINLGTGRSITRGTDSDDRITFNDGNTTVGNAFIVNNSISVRGASGSDGNIFFYDDDKSNYTTLSTNPSTNANTNVYLPYLSSGTDTLVSLVATQTLENKTMKFPFNILDGNNTHKYEIYPSVLGTDRNLFLPALNQDDTFVCTTQAQTLTNKTISSSTATLTSLEVNTNPIQVKGTSSGRGYINFYDNGTTKHISLMTETAIGGSSNSYNLILPSIADTLITKTSTDTLTNKTLDGAVFSSTPSFNATLRLNGGTGLPGIIDFYDIDGSHAIGIRSPDDLTSNFNLTLPAITDTLVSKNSSDVLQNKTFGDDVTCEARILMKNSTAAAITAIINSSTDGLVIGAGAVDVLTDTKIRHLSDTNEYIEIGDTFNINYDIIKVKEYGKIMNANDPGNNDYIQLAPDVFYSNCLENRFKAGSKLGNDTNMNINLRFNSDHTLFKGNVKTENGAIYLGTDNSTIHLDCAVNHSVGSSNGSSYFTCYYNGTQIGDIRQASTSSVSYNTTSDYRLKTDIEDFNNNLSLINKLKVKKYKFISDKDANINQDFIGFIAHEVQEVDAIFNGVVNGEKDQKEMFCNKCNNFYCHCPMDCNDMVMKDKYQSIDYSKMSPILVGSVQELYKIIQEQQVEINELRKLIQPLL